MHLIIAEEMRKEQNLYVIKLTIMYQPGWFMRLLGYKDEVTIGEYIGSCTVWRDYTTFTRCSLDMEYRLADVWSRLKFQMR
jgi:hypothetical protein